MAMGMVELHKVDNIMHRDLKRLQRAYCPWGY
jgi:hypothetical protein